MKMIGGLVKCQFCLAPFPESWIRQREYGASQDGVFHFCSAKCRALFRIENHIPDADGRTTKLRLELKNLRH